MKQHLYREYIKTSSEVPKGPHFAVIVYETTSYWTDHGYPEDGGSTVTIHSPRHYVFLDEKEWTDYIHYLETRTYSLYEKKPTYVAFKVDKLAVIEQKTIVTVG